MKCDVKISSLKLLYTLLYLGCCFGLSAIKSNSNDILISVEFDRYYIKQGKGATSFIVQSNQLIQCDLSFLALPALSSDGKFSIYTISVNGIPIEGNVVFSSFGWQETNTQGSSITLNEGDNIITFSSRGKELPQIRNIELFEKKEQQVNYKEKSIIGVSNAAYSIPPPNYVAQPLFRPGVSMNCPYTYTFVLPLQYSAGEIASFYSPTSNDPRFGMYTSSVDYTIYFFHENPILFSDSRTSSNKYLLWSIPITHSGTYYALVEARLPVAPLSNPYVSLFVDNSVMYPYNPVSCTTTQVQKEDASCNVIVSSRDSYYNIFTVNPRSANANHEADPCLWLKKKILGKDIVVAYNDNNIVPSNFSWGKNAQIQTYLEDKAEYNVLLSSANPLYYESETCDLYHSFWNNVGGGWETSLIDFVNLKYGDAIESDNEGYRLTEFGYNCFAWSGGMNAHEIAPTAGSTLEQEIKFFDAYYNNEYVNGLYGVIMRPQGSLRYVRNGVTDENAIVDLWVNFNSTSQRSQIVHASIRSYSHDGIAHGYDWESRLGRGLPRIFHPRYALSGSEGYGQVLFSYRIADGQGGLFRSSERVLAEAIADETYQIEQINLTDNERYDLAESIQVIPLKVQNEYKQLYSAWKKATRRFWKESNILSLRECDEYAALLNFVQMSPYNAFLIYQSFMDGDFDAAVPIRDLALHPLSRTRKIWNNIMNEMPLNNRVRTSRANVTLYLKAVLQERETPIISEVIRSNDDIFNLSVQSNQVTVKIDLAYKSRYSIRAICLATNKSYPLSSFKEADKGIYSYTRILPSGTYVVEYCLNENLNCKKIVVP